MTIVVRRPPVRTLDGDGREILLVPLANSNKSARVFPEDYARLVAAGFSPNWFENCGAVKVADWRNGVKRVCRLIHQPVGDARVSPVDRDPLNLRSDNLESRPFVRRKATTQPPAGACG